MERKTKINEKERDSFKFDYQELIEENALDIAELPEMMAMMIHKTDEHLKEALSKCTEGHCTNVILELQPYADFILEELYSHYDERISGNIIEGEEPDEPEKAEDVAKPNLLNSDEEIIIELTKQNQDQLAEINELKKREKKSKKKMSNQSHSHKEKVLEPIDENKRQVKEIDELKIEEEKIKPIQLPSDEEVILACSKESQDEFTEQDLRKRGFKGKLSRRYIQVGGFVLKKLLFQPYWEIIPSSEIIAKL